MKAKLYIIILFVFFIRCSSYEKIGDYKYKTTIKRINTGEFDALIKNIKSYNDPKKDTFLFGYTIKAQKLNFEREKDSVFVTSKFKYDYRNKTITTVEIFQNGYDTFLQTDSIVRKFTQNKNGSIILKSYAKYVNGIEAL